MPKVSVVMCCYNSERYIKETIDSVLGQTFTDFEFIIWNDGSTDSTENIILGYSDERIKYFKDINRGEGLAAQLACSHVSAPYISRIDSDDVWLPGILSEEYDYMESHPETVLISCPVLYIDADSKVFKRIFLATRTDYLKKSIDRGNCFVHSGAMYRTEIYLKVGGYSDVRLIQDHLLFKKMSKYGDLALLKKPYVKYRMLPNSVAHRVDNSPYRDIIELFHNKIIKDNGTNEDDLHMLNLIYNKIRADNTGEVDFYKLDFQNRLFLFMRKFLGEEIANRIIVYLKNLLSYML